MARASAAETPQSTVLRYYDVRIYIVPFRSVTINTLECRTTICSSTMQFGIAIVVVVEESSSFVRCIRLLYIVWRSFSIILLTPINAAITKLNVNVQYTVFTNCRRLSFVGRRSVESPLKAESCQRRSSFVVCRSSFVVRRLLSSMSNDQRPTTNDQRPTTNDQLTHSLTHSLTLLFDDDDVVVVVVVVVVVRNLESDRSACSTQTVGNGVMLRERGLDTVQDHTGQGCGSGSETGSVRV